MGVSRCGFISIIGQTNVGKSTLLNALVGDMVSIVSHKVQTTRSRILGLRVVDDTQLIFVDTPGIFSARDMLDKAMVSSALAQIADGDIVLVLVSAAQGVTDHTETILETLEKSGKKAILVLNKVDLVPKESLLALSAQLFQRGVFSAVYMVSALKSKGIDDLLAHLVSVAPVSPHLYPYDTLTDMPVSTLAAEITRRSVYLYVHQEIPYAVHVVTDSYAERHDGSVEIRQTLYVEKDNQKPIILGAGGQRLKTIGMKSKEDLKALLGIAVHLFITVKVKSWRKDVHTLSHLGLTPSS